MINVKNEKINGIPVLHIAKQSEWEKPLPFVMFIHGFTSAKEHNLHYAYLLAEKGYRVVLPDAWHHGERDEGLSEKKKNYLFWDIVLQEIKEVQDLKIAFEESGLIDPERIGLAGTSMGGITTYGALTQYPWVKAAVSLMGSPYYEKFARQQINGMKEAGVDLPFDDEELEETFSTLKPYDISKQLDKFNGRPILIWHGEEDKVVPFSHSKKIHEELIPIYSSRPDKLRFITDPGVAHKVTRRAVLETVQWFEKFV